MEHAFGLPMAADDKTAILETYYGALSIDGGFEGTCRMVLPDDLAGKRILDVECRNGKGAFALAECAGADGFVLGVDHDATAIARAREGAEAAWRRAGLPASNMEFAVCYPEELQAAGVPAASFDLVFCNCSMNLTYDLEEAFSSQFAVLAPGGRLLFDATVASAPRDLDVLASARVVGNAVQASLFFDDLRALLMRIGFVEVERRDEGEVDYRQGARPDLRVPFIDLGEEAAFLRSVITARKPG